jgi:hypothetical protein
MRGFWIFFRIGSLLWLGALGAPGLAGAKSDTPMPPDLFGPNADPGYHGVLELNGKRVHNVGHILLNVTNFGMLGSQPGTYRPWAGAPSAQWPAGSGVEYLWSAGLWIGAEKNGEQHVTTGQYEMEFRPGLTAQDRIYQTREGAPGGGRTPSPSADDDGDGKIDEDWLDGRDNDGDGRIDEDFGAISNQMFFCEYSDSDPHIKLTYPEHEPLGLLVQQTSLAWDGPLLENFIGFDYKLINTGFDGLAAVYVGIFADCDVGPRDTRDTSSDDMAGFWEGTAQSATGQKNVDLSMGYMWDADGDDGQSEGYIGFMFLGAEYPGSADRAHHIGLRNFRSFAGRGAFALGGDPTSDTERYSVLDGTARFSLSGASSGRAPQSTPTSNDYRLVVSAGPWGGGGPGDTLGFQAAIVIGRGFDGLKESAAQAQVLFDGTWMNCDHDPQTGVDGRESPRCAPEHSLEWFYIRGPGLPGVKVTTCDTNCVPERQRNIHDAKCWVQAPYRDGCVWIDSDCNPTTGVNGNECLLRWLISTAPEPPNMRLLAKENEVDILWDNRSETIPDPMLNVTDFESYRIWRADNWRRPIGSDADIGPGANLWMLLAEFDLPGNGIGGDTGLEGIRYAPVIPDRTVEFYREWDRAHPFQDPPMLPGFTPDQIDTARTLGRGVRYYRFVDPPFVGRPSPNDPPCGSDGACDPIQTEGRVIYRRCDSRGRCRPTSSPPHTGQHYFYSVTATDHKLKSKHGVLVPNGPGLAGDPATNFKFIDPPSDALRPEQYDQADQEIYVVPNPATRESMTPWRLHPNNSDPSGWKLEFHHLPAATGKVTIFTIAGDMVKALPFDGRAGNGSAKWDLVNRNGQDATSGVYLYTVEADDANFKRFVGKFVVVR